MLSECFYSMYVCMYVEMERLQTEGRRTRMGSLNAIVFSCGTVTIYLAGVAVQCDGLRSPQKKAKRPPPFFPFCQLVLRTSLANWNTGNEKRTGWKITPTGRRSNFGFQICGVKRATRGESGGGGQDARPCEDAARRSTISASWQTHDKHLCPGRFPG